MQCRDESYAVSVAQIRIEQPAASMQSEIAVTRIVWHSITAQAAMDNGIKTIASQFLQIFDVQSRDKAGMREIVPHLSSQSTSLTRTRMPGRLCQWSEMTQRLLRLV